MKKPRSWVGVDECESPTCYSTGYSRVFRVQRWIGKAATWGAVEILCGGCLIGQRWRYAK